MPLLPSMYPLKGSNPRIFLLEVFDKKKAPNAEPIGYVLVERVETVELYPDTKLVNTAQIYLSGKLVAAQFDFRERDFYTKFEFCGSYDRMTNAVSLTSSCISSEGAIFLDLPSQMKGQRVGTFLLNEIVVWAKKWPEAQVRSVKLISGQATPDNKARRNRLYEQFGLVFQYDNEKHETGTSVSMAAADLNPVETWRENINLVLVPEFLFKQHRLLLSAKHDVKNCMESSRRLHEELVRAEDHPIRLTVQQWKKKLLRLFLV